MTLLGGLNLILGWALLVMVVAVIPAALYVTYVWARRVEEARFFTRLMLQDIRVAIGVGILIALFFLRAIVRIDVNPDWAGLLTRTAFILLLYGVISDAWTVYRVRHGGSIDDA